MVTTLKGIGVYQTKLLVENNPTTSLFTEILIPILSLHVLPRKDALLELEVDAVGAESFGKEL